MRYLTIILICYLLCLPFLGYMGCLFIQNVFIKSRISPDVIFPLPIPRPEVLTDSEMLRYAKAALAQRGYNADEWQPLADDGTLFDETKNIFIAGNVLNPRIGTMQFVKRGDDKFAQRLVVVEMRESDIVCQVIIPK